MIRPSITLIYSTIFDRAMGMISEDPHKVISNAYFLALTNTTTDIIALIDPKDLTVNYINRVQAGYTVDEVLGKSVFTFGQPEHEERHRKAIEQVLRTGEPLTIEYETQSRRPETNRAWYRCTISLIKDSEGRTENILEIYTDITNARLQEIEIHNKQVKLFAIINNTSDIILSIDRDLNLTEYNAIFGALVERGFGKKDLNGTPLLNYIDPRKHDHLRAIYSRVFSGEAVHEVESFGTHDGNSLYYETSYNPIHNYHKEVTGISIFSKNVTERTHNEKKLKNTLKEREVLLAEIHHRIKNNLALVSSLLQLKEMNLENEAAKEALSDSRKRIKSTALVHEMLYRNETFDKIQLKEYLTELFGNLNSNPNIMLRLEGDNHIFELNKALPFGLMVHELMMNSFKHSFKGRDMAELSINSEVDDKGVHIKYCDCSGVFPDNVNFNDTSTTGLMLIHTFIEQLGGSIELVTKDPPSYYISIPF